MIDLVRKIFNKKMADDSLQSKDSSNKIEIAACALLLEMANTDEEFSDVEKGKIVEILKKNFNLSSEMANELIELTNKELEESIDLWQFTNLINKNYSIEQKLELIEMIWKVVYADGKLDKYEDYLVHKLSKLLRLDHKQLIDAKLKVIQLKKDSTD